ncbi:type VI secretion system lipoprotein TssJ [Halomonas cupida]|uniref:type VI secretion system lipoprotein TssJ n=1 Tax=Halomonas cupida TaxID=44933 RepID=UPI003A949C57
MITRREVTQHTQYRRGLWSLLLVAILSSLLAGCGISGRVGKQFDGTVGDILFDQNEKVVVTLEGDEYLNPDADDNPLSVVVRIYQLDSLTAFNAASPQLLWQDSGEALGDSLLSEREVVMLPQGEVVDSAPMAVETRYIAVAAFFRQVPDNRWRLVFDAAEMRKDGILTSPDGVTVHLAGHHIEAVDDSAELLVSSNDQ